MSRLVMSNIEMFSRIPLCWAKDAPEDSLKLPLAEHMGCIRGSVTRRRA
ncbi:hypothetical protein A2U01_0073020 [Trifolium medium]|uniref:Uncharacterized protein n=1 Tax=Trifolium medium TaxID=97028 RepID=A0A392SV88_9FABA|nr:hypothetical protein [Trifolium medium]